MTTKGYSFSVVGGREMNQDSFLVNDAKSLYAVADGVGGGMDGDVASKMATTGLDELASDFSVNLVAVFKQIQQRVLSHSLSEFGEPVMGTTLTAVRIEGNELSLCHVGDSRAYYFSQGELSLLSEDHELYDERIQGTVLASYMGIPSDVHPLKIQERSHGVKVGDLVILCSDGLYRQLSEKRICDILATHASDLQKAAQMLCEEAAQKDYSDNVTVVLVAVGS